MPRHTVPLRTDETETVQLPRFFRLHFALHRPCGIFRFSDSFLLLSTSDIPAQGLKSIPLWDKFFGRTADFPTPVPPILNSIRRNRRHARPSVPHRRG